MVADVIADYRVAARAIVRDPHLDHRRRLVALMRLGARARKEDDPPGWYQMAVWVEAAPYITGRDKAQFEEAYPHPVDVAIRRLLTRGLDRCDRCHRPLPTAEELERDRMRREWNAEQARVREEAVRVG
jgi:hypothetical protein